jgi:hypothetical protein
MPRGTVPENAPACKSRVSLDGVGTTTRTDLVVDVAVWLVWLYSSGHTEHTQHTRGVR